MPTRWRAYRTVIPMNARPTDIKLDMRFTGTDALDQPQRAQSDGLGVGLQRSDSRVHLRVDQDHPDTGG